MTILANNITQHKSFGIELQAYANFFSEQNQVYYNNKSHMSHLEA